MDEHAKDKALPKTGIGSMAYIGLGSNLGDRREMLRSALLGLDAHPELRIDFSNGIASIYQTSPVGDGFETNTDSEGEQPHFFNSAARVSTTLSPQALLDILLAVEVTLGRTRAKRWEARTIDLDLLLFGDLVVRDATLEIPHPRLDQRRFVLEPLAEIAGEVMHPVLGVTMEALRDRLRVDGLDQHVKLEEDATWMQTPAQAEDCRSDRRGSCKAADRSGFDRGGEFSRITP